MKNRPIHENLNTSFVNLAALLRHLRGEKFAGQVRVELKDYEADITLTASGAITAREHDRAAGRVAEGDEALQRILIRARAPGGVVHVFQMISENEVVAANRPQVSVKTGEKIVERKSLDTAVSQPAENVAASLAQNIKTLAPPAKAGQNGHLRTTADAQAVVAVAETAADTNAPRANPQLPFEFTNRVENKARRTNLAPEEWRTLLNLTGELLATVDDVFAKADIDFAAALGRTRAEVSVDYPFLNPKSNVFNYINGQVTMSEQTNHKIFVGGVNETLRRIFDRLAKNPKFSNLHRLLADNVHALVTARRPLYEKFSITPQLERIIDR